MSSLRYKGNVKITFKKSIYKRYNNGTDFLFNQFCKWLAGEITNITPKYIDIVNVDSNGFIVGTCLTGPINITSIQSAKDDDTGDPVTRVSALVQKSNLNQPGDISYRLNLMNDDEQIIAHIGIDKAIIDKIKRGRDALIEWDMSLENKEG